MVEALKIIRDVMHHPMEDIQSISYACKDLAKWILLAYNVSRYKGNC